MKELFKNCLEVFEEDGWLVPTRFTERQRELYGKDSGKDIRAKSPSSVMLSFRSDATELSFDYRIGGRARSWAVVDVVVNGCLYSSQQLTADSGRVTLALSGDASAETHVYLPHLVVFALKDIRANGELTPAENKKKYWISMGDSITQGMVATHPSCSYPSLLAEYFDVDLLNTGVGGIRFNPAELDNTDRKPDLVTVALGCNDWTTAEPDQLAKSTDEYLGKLTSFYGGSAIYGILPIWRSDAEDADKAISFEQCREIIRNAYAKYPVIKLIDGYKILPHSTEYYGDPSERQIHPNDKGFMYMALSLARELKDVLG